MMGYASDDLAIAFINVILLGLLFVIGIAIARMRSLFGIVMLSGIYSLISATWFVALDAVDVAFTEAAVGAGISTALLLGAMLVYASIDLPAFGDPDSPANTYVGTDYIYRTPEDIGVPNIVTAVLASYRGFDTLGETGVVFAAALSVILLLGFGERSLSATFNRRKKDKSGDA